MSRNAFASSIPASAPNHALETDTANSKWNTKSLGLRLGVDTASATTAGALTCPLITIIDRAIIEKAAKGYPIAQTTKSCLKSMISRPANFLLSTPFLLIYTLYTSTYLTANTIDTVTSTVRNQSFSTVTPGIGKFLTTTTVNMALCVYKDARFARIFGPGSSSASITPSSSSLPPSFSPSYTPKPPQPQSQTHPQIPKISYTLFCLRDSITIFASFNIPPLLAPHIPDSLAPTANMKTALAQFTCPALMQFASTPLHLLGLDLYNRQPVGGLGWGERVARIRRDYVASSFARMAKIVPAFGVGGVVNVWMRRGLMEVVEGVDS